MKPPKGVTVIGLDDPAELHNAIADAVGEPRLYHRRMTEKQMLDLLTQCQADPTNRGNLDALADAIRTEDWDSYRQFRARLADLIETIYPKKA
jgi:hypothetical protein